MFIPLDHLLARMARDPTLVEVLAYHPALALGAGLWEALQKTGWVQTHHTHSDILRDGTSVHRPRCLSMRLFTAHVAKALGLSGPVRSFRLRGETHDFYNLGRLADHPNAVVFFIPRCRPRSLAPLLKAIDRPPLTPIALLSTWDLTSSLRTDSRVMLAVLADFLMLQRDGTLTLTTPLLPPAPRPAPEPAAPPAQDVTPSAVPASTPEPPPEPPPQAPEPPPALPPADPDPAPQPAPAPLHEPDADRHVCMLYSPAHPFGRGMTRAEAFAYLQAEEDHDILLDASSLGRGCCAWVRGSMVQIQPSLARILARIMSSSGRALTPAEIPGCSGDSGRKRIELARRTVDPGDGEGWAWFHTDTSEGGTRYRFGGTSRWAVLVDAGGR